MDIIHAHNDRNQEFSLGVGGGKSPITDPSYYRLPTNTDPLSYISNYKRYTHIICT